MPIYAYRCSTCGRAKDVLQKMSDPLLSECPFCGAPTFVKQVTAAGFQLKGSGWYVTDFRGGDSKAPKTGDAEGARDPAKSDSKEGEGKSVEAKAGAARPGDSAPATPAPSPSKGESGSAPAAAAPSPAPAAPSSGGTGTGPASK